MCESSCMLLAATSPTYSHDRNSLNATFLTGRVRLKCTSPRMQYCASGALSLLKTEKRISASDCLSPIQACLHAAYILFCRIACLQKVRCEAAILSRLKQQDQICPQCKSTPMAGPVHLGGVERQQGVWQALRGLQALHILHQKAVSIVPWDEHVPHHPLHALAPEAQ